MNETVCDNCIHKCGELIIGDLWCDFCEEESENFMTADGCYRYEERKEEE